MKLHQSKAFTLVELIVVITILAILATIAFLSFQGYSKQTRDTSRVADMRNIASGLGIFFSKNGNYPQPDNSININASGTILGYQGYLGSGTMNLIKLGGKGIDPLDSTYYTYYLGTNNKIQLLGYLEGTKESIGITTYTNKIKETYAGSVDYTKRNVYTIGSKLGILLQSGSLVPAQDNLSNTFTGVDIVNTNSGYLAYTSNTDTPITGTGNTLRNLIINTIGTNYKSCNDILQNNTITKNVDGVYTINPTGTGSFQVYCDMITDNGGWTLITKIKSDNRSHVNISSYNQTLLTSFEGFNPSSTAKFSDSTIDLILKSGENIIRGNCNNIGNTYFKINFAYSSVVETTNATNTQNMSNAFSSYSLAKSSTWNNTPIGVCTASQIGGGYTFISGTVGTTSGMATMNGTTRCTLSSISGVNGFVYGYNIVSGNQTNGCNYGYNGYMFAK